MLHNHMTPPTSNRSVKIVGIILTALCVQLAFTWAMVVQVEREMWADVLQQAQVLKQAINIDRIKTLTGTAADLSNPDYQRLEKQLLAVREVNPKFNGLSLLGRAANGDVISYVDANTEHASSASRVIKDDSGRFRQAFASQTAIFAGPAPESGGRALVLIPLQLVDPRVGGVFALLKVDVNTAGWNKEVATRSALPIVLLGLLLVCIATLVYPSTDSLEIIPGQMRRHLLPALILLVTILVAGGSSLLYLQYQRHLEKNVASDLATVTSGLSTALEQNTAELVAIGQPITANAEVQQALGAGDAERLSVTWIPIFERLQQIRNITHLYFLDANRVCLLRVHQPQRSGDRIDRSTALEAERTGKVAVGLELGPLGTFTLRMVQPVFAGSTRVGYIELGMEIEPLLRPLYQQSSTQLLMVLRKAYLNRDGWQEGMHLLGRADAAQWDRMAKSVVSYTTLPNLSAEVLTWADTFANDHLHGDLKHALADGEKTWRVAATPIRDASGQGVGDLLILRDITADRALSRHTLLLGGAVTVALLLLAWNLMYRLLGRIDRRIAAEQAKLTESEHLYRTQFTENAAIMLQIDPADGAILGANIAAQMFYGYSHEQLLTMRIADINVKPPTELQLIGDAVLSGACRQFEFQHRLADGSLRDVRVSLSSILVEGRTILHSIVHDITERIKSVRLLAQAKEEADAIIANFLDTLIVVNTHLIITRINQATCDLLGFSEEELIGKSVLALFHDADAYVHSLFTFYSEQNGQTGDMEELRNVELCYRHKNGGRLPMSFNLHLLRNDYGTITGVVAGAKDIAQLRLALDKIACQKEDIEMLFHIVPQGLLVLSSSQEVIKQNRAFKQLLYTWSRPLAMTPKECSRILIEKILARQFENNTSFTVHIQRDDVTAYFRCGVTHLSVLEGATSIISIEDITDERKAEAARSLLATVIEQTGDSVLIADTDAIIRYVNPAALKNSGFSADELVGSTLPVFNTDVTDASVIAEFRKTLTGGQIWHGTFKSTRKDDSVMEEDVILSVVRNQEGGITHYVAVKRDMTEMANLQRQLLQAQKLEAIGQLAAGIAHEINTPMQYVQTNVTFFEQVFKDLSQLLITVDQTERSLLAAETAALMDTIDLNFLLAEMPASIKETYDGINLVVEMVAAMKTFSHASGTDMVATDLNRAMESTIIVCRNEWRKVAEMVTDFDPDLPLVPCFPDQLNQVILNLIINAVHAIAAHANPAAEGDEGGTIRVATLQEDDWVVISVSDTGGGIPAAIQQRVFEPFFTTKEVGKGTGQGLALAHDIVVNKHRGRIDFTSEPGQGTTFSIRLPREGNPIKLNTEGTL